MKPYWNMHSSEALRLLEWLLKASLEADAEKSPPVHPPEDFHWEPVFEEEEDPGGGSDSTGGLAALVLDIAWEEMLSEKPVPAR